MNDERTLYAQQQDRIAALEAELAVFKAAHDYRCRELADVCGKVLALEAELAERTRDLDYANERAASHLDDAYKLRNELTAERERREAAEAVLQEYRIRLHACGRRPEECWEMSEIDGHFAHFARKGER